MCSKKKEAQEILTYAGLKMQRIPGDAVSCFESHNGFEFILLLVLDFADDLTVSNEMEIYFKANRLLFFCKLTEKDSKRLEEIEEEISDLENDIAQNMQMDIELNKTMKLFTVITAIFYHLR